MPPQLEVLGSKAFLEGHGVGTQNYVCVPSAASAGGVANVPYTPEAALFSDGLVQLTTHYIQRVNTSGGFAPSTGCASQADLGNQAFVPYTADYFFYTSR